MMENSILEAIKYGAVINTVASTCVCSGFFLLAYKFHKDTHPHRKMTQTLVTLYIALGLLVSTITCTNIGILWALLFDHSYFVTVLCKLWQTSTLLYSLYAGLHLYHNYITPRKGD